MLEYCNYCESFVELTEGKCCSCGQQLASHSNDTHKYYLPEPCEVPTEEVEQLWERARRFMGVGNLNAAGRLCNKILGICPGHNSAKTLYNEIQSRSQRAREFYDSIQDGLNRQPLGQLSTLLSEAVEIYPDHPDGHLVQTQLLSATTEYKDVIQEGIKAIVSVQADFAKLPADFINDGAGTPSR